MSCTCTALGSAGSTEMTQKQKNIMLTVGVVFLGVGTSALANVLTNTGAKKGPGWFLSGLFIGGGIYAIARGKS